MFKTYSELSALQTFEERFKYLKLGGKVADETFGFERYLNQKFYHSKEWLRIKDQVIIRDQGCDLGIKGRDIHGQIIVHHMNPIGITDLKNFNSDVMNPEYLICVSLDTHNAIHYGNDEILRQTVVERSKNDTCPWKK